MDSPEHEAKVLELFQAHPFVFIQSTECAFGSGHLTLLSGAGEGEAVSKEVGEEERGARGGVDRRSDNATSVDVEIDPHRRRLGRRQIDFALQAIVDAARRPRRKRNESNHRRRPCVFLCFM